MRRVSSASCARGLGGCYAPASCLHHPRAPRLNPMTGRPAGPARLLRTCCVLAPVDSDRPFKRASLGLSRVSDCPSAKRNELLRDGSDPRGRYREASQGGPGCRSQPARARSRPSRRLAAVALGSGVVAWQPVRSCETKSTVPGSVTRDGPAQPYSSSICWAALSMVFSSAGRSAPRAASARSAAPEQARLGSRAGHLWQCHPGKLGKSRDRPAQELEQRIRRASHRLTRRRKGERSGS
jgi:hypothetical protein